MHARQSELLARVLTGAAAVLIIIGLMVLTGAVSRGGEPPGIGAVKTPHIGRFPQDWPTPSQVPRPNETSAKSVDEAKKELSQNASLDAIIKAAEAGDASRLVDLTQKHDGYCSSSRQLPVECKSLTDNVPAVYFDVSRSLWPVDTMRKWLAGILSNGPISLEFVARDSRLPAGDGGRYYIIFRASAAANDFSGLDGVGLIVSPGRPDPIETITFFEPGEKGLIWVQYVSRDGAKYLILITPESVKGWPGL